VDRITPATTDRERDDVRAALGVEDASPVPTEPFSEWVITGRFPAGRPAWEEAGALVVGDVEPFEHRKLRMLNGSHSLQAYAGSIRGHATVADAISDPLVRVWVEEWWDAVARHLAVPCGDYRASLRARFGNPRIQHRLAQIAMDGSQKLPVRVIPVVREELAAGALGDGALRPVAAWVQHLRGLGAPVKDATLPGELALVGADLPTAVARVMAYLAPDLAADRSLVGRVTRLAEEVAR
jgi:fructuronate reductase